METKSEIDEIDHVLAHDTDVVTDPWKETNNGEKSEPEREVMVNDDVEYRPTDDASEGEQVRQHGTTTINRNLCYILINDRDNKTYNGYTNNPNRRIRQHNGEIKGGAKFTTRKRKVDGIFSRDWEYLLIVESPGMCQTKALSLEWHIKYPTCRKPRPREFNGANGRLRGLPLSITHRKFAGMCFVIHVTPRYFEKAKSVLLSTDNVKKYADMDIRVQITKYDFPTESSLYTV